MARRNPLEERKKEYFKNLKFHIIHPWLLYYKCVKCGDEFCREPMYKCDVTNIVPQYCTGCTHCFKSKEEFRKYLEDNRMIFTEADFQKK